MLWRLKTRYLLYDFHPLVLLYAVGTFGVGASAIGAVGSVALTSTPVLGVLSSLVLFVVSVAVVGVGATLDLSANADRELRLHEWDAPTPNGRPPSGESNSVDHAREEHVDHPSEPPEQRPAPSQSQ
jgi:hypothetical protein